MFNFINLHLNKLSNSTCVLDKIIHRMETVRAVFVFAGRSSEFSRSNLYIHGYVFRRFRSRSISLSIVRQGCQKNTHKNVYSLVTSLYAVYANYSGLLFQTERPSSEFYLTNDDGASQWKRQSNEIETSRGCIVCLGRKYLFLVRPTKHAFNIFLKSQKKDSSRHKKSIIFIFNYILNAYF